MNRIYQVIRISLLPLLDRVTMRAVTFEEQYSANDNVNKTHAENVDRNPDPITGAPGSHPVGTGIGSASGAATGAAVGALGGPVGAAIGGVAGAVVGAVIGHKTGEAHDPTEDFSRPGDHADPAAAVTNPTPTASVTTSGRPVNPPVREARRDDRILNND